MTEDKAIKISFKIIYVGISRLPEGQQNQHKTPALNFKGIKTVKDINDKSHSFGFYASFFHY